MRDPGPLDPTRPLWWNCLMGKTVNAAAAGFIMVLAMLSSSAGAEMRKCVGPGGDVRFTNQECPEGYTLEASRPATERSSPEEPYICRFSSTLASTEVVSALTEAENSLAEAKAKGDADSARYWQNCLDQIRLRQAALQTPPPAPAEEQAPAECTEGTFDYREDGIFFTSATRSPCVGVKATCTFEIRESHRITTTGRGVRDRRQESFTSSSSQRVLKFNHTGRVGRFGTVRIGDVNLPGRVTGWNCRIE